MFLNIYPIFFSKFQFDALQKKTKSTVFFNLKVFMTVLCIFSLRFFSHFVNEYLEYLEVGDEEA